jgi:hypothetical protein
MLNIFTMLSFLPVSPRGVVSILLSFEPSQRRACEVLGQSIGRLKRNYTCGSRGASTRNAMGAVFLLAAGSIETRPQAAGSSGRARRGIPRSGKTFRVFARA